MNGFDIAPDYSFRFTDADIKATYKSSEGAFDHGDFLTAAQFTAVDAELKGCSLILGGLLEQGLALTEGRDDLTARTRLCRSLALWSLNRIAEAKAELAHIDEPALASAARKFRELIDRDNVNVFITGAILSIFPEHYSSSFLAPSFKYGSITVKYVASQLRENAYEWSPSQPLDELIKRLPAEEQPDILFALSPQWLLPKNFEKVAMPKVIWCHDTDAFHYRNIDNFALYDVAICNCSQEHFELSQGTPGLYCAANMLLHPLATPFPEASPHGEKTIDIIFTGSALAPFHSEKPRFLFNLAALGSECKVMVVDGHLPEKDYFALISKAKFLPVVNRYAGSPSPRWRDALANGSFLLYPEGSFYGEIAPGCFSFNAETLIDDVRKHIKAFAAQKDPAYDLSKVVPVINKRFAIHRQAREQSFERLLKYALFMGIVWRGASNAAQKPKRRLVWLTPAVDCGLFGTEHIRGLIKEHSDSIARGELIDAIDYNNAAHLNAQYVYAFSESVHSPECASRANRYFRQGLKRFPKSLLLHFNQAHWLFLKPNADTAAAAGKFASILSRFDDLEFDALGADVAFAYTLHERDAIFPCYEYADVATTEMVLKETPELLARKSVRFSTREIVRSACHGYIAWAKLKSGDRPGAVAAFRDAIDIYPHGLPMLRLYFDTLLQKCVEEEIFAAKDIFDLAEAFVAVANVNPSILLTHVYIMVPILGDNGAEEAARGILAAWHRLANIIHRMGPQQDDRSQATRLAPLWHYRALFPKALTKRLDAILWQDESLKDVTQLERGMIAALTIYEQNKGSYASKRRTIFGSQRKVKYEQALTATLSAAPRGGERILPSHLKRAWQVWLWSPREVKRAYLKKAAHRLAQGDFRQALLRTQDWGTTSKWSTEASLMQRREAAWRRLLRRLLQRMTLRQPGPRS